MTDQQPQQTNPWGIETLSRRYYGFIDELSSSKRKAYGFGWLAIAIVLTVAASLPLANELRWVSALVGSPAGVIFFVLILGLIHSTRLGDSAIFRFKDTTPPRRRVPIVAIGLIVIAAILITTGSFLPIGLGGVLAIIAALSAYNIIRRTPEELQLAAQGIPDPREIEGEE